MNLFGKIATWFMSSERSLENPRTPLDPWSPLADAFGSGQSSAGIRVTRQRALTYSAVWRCVNLVSRTVGKLPLGVYKNLDPGRLPDYGHNADFLLRCRPNQYMRPHTWKQLATAHVLLQGNHYSYIDRGGDARPLELLPLDPERVVPVRENGELWYCYEPPEGEREWIRAENMIHIKGLGYDGLEGYSVLTMARESMGLGLATQKYGAVYFANAARPSVILTHPGKLSDSAKKNLKQSWERLSSGVDNAHRTTILDEGVVVKELTINARDSQLIEGKQFSLVDIANWFHVPPHRVGSMVNVSYGSLEQENQSFADDGIEPWLVAIEEELEEKTLSDWGRKRNTHSIAFDRTSLVRPPLLSRYDGYTKAIASGIMNPDEARAEEGLNPIEGGLGKQYFRPGNLVPLDPDKVPAPAPLVAPDGSDGNGDDKIRSADLAQACERIVADVYRRAVKRISHQAARAAKQPGKIFTWIESLTAEHLDAIGNELRSPIYALSIALFKPVPLDTMFEAGKMLARIQADLLEAAGRAKDAEELAAQFAATLAAIESDYMWEAKE